MDNNSDFRKALEDRLLNLYSEDDPTMAEHGERVWEKQVALAMDAFDFRCQDVADKVEQDLIDGEFFRDDMVETGAVSAAWVLNVLAGASCKSISGDAFHIMKRAMITAGVKGIKK